MSTMSVCFAGASSFTGRQVAPLQRTCAQRGAKRGALPQFAVRRARAMADAEPAKPSIDAPVASSSTSSPSDTGIPMSSSGDEPVPGKIELNELELAAQKTALDKLTLELRKVQMEEDREAARLFGWVPYAETLNGRLAMFFILTGVLTEYWTGYTLPQQVELMLRTLGFF